MVSLFLAIIYLAIVPPNLESKLGSTSPQFWAEVPANFWLKFSPPLRASFPSRVKNGGIFVKDADLKKLGGNKK